jgi:hypothetical protein
MMIFGYYIIQLPLDIFPKFIFVALVTFGGSLVVYEIFIKRYNFMRALFGLKSQNKIKFTQEKTSTNNILPNED